VDGLGERWHAHDTSSGSVLKAGESVRLFDVTVDAAGKTPLTYGCTTVDYEVPFIIGICYGSNENYNELIQADFESILYSLHNCNVSAVTGLNYYLVNDSTITEQEGSRYNLINGIARISAERS
jgi:hypothetical protein